MMMPDAAPSGTNPEPTAGRLRYDALLLGTSLALVLIGYIMVTSASLHIGERLFDDSFHYPWRQLIHIGAGAAIGIACAFVPLIFWEKTGFWLLVAVIALLGLVLIPGVGIEVNGSTRWLALLGVRIQVSEMVKLITILYLAGYISRHLQSLRESEYGMIRPLSLLGVVSVLLLLEPDFGAAAVILATALGMLFLSGARLRQFVVLMASVVGSGAILVYLSPYRLARLTSFWNPWADPYGSGFQLIQALIALGRGEWLGVGLGGSIQKLFYLPEAHTDFLFSVVGEELGLLGVVTVIVLFAILVWRAFLIGAHAEREGRRFAAFLAYGLGIWFGLQAFINMGVNMGLLPTKGLTLPLMSYGGSSMVVMCAALGLCCRVQRETFGHVAATPKEKPEWLGAS